VSLHAAPLSDPVQREAFPRLLPRDQFRKMARAARAAGTVDMVLSPLQGRSPTSPDRPNPGTYHGILHSFSETPVLEEQIRESLPAATTWLPKTLTVRAQLTKDLCPWPPSSPERLTTHMLVPILSA
jgi:hypothetical protein